MKKLFPKFVIMMIMMASLLSCGNTRRSTPNTNITPSMTIGYTMNASMNQIDSICMADTLPTFKNWLSNEFKDAETGDVILKRVYVKQRNDYEVTYIAVGTNEPYEIIQRIKK